MDNPDYKREKIDDEMRLYTVAATLRNGNKILTAARTIWKTSEDDAMIDMVNHLSVKYPDYELVSYTGFEVKNELISRHFVPKKINVQNLKDGPAY